MCVKSASLRSGQGHGPCAAARLTQFQGGKVIAKTKEQLQKECAELEKRIRHHRNRLQRLEQRTKHIAKGERQKRAHRLITHGAAVESVAPTVRVLSEREFYELIERIFALPEVQALLPKGGE
jgi:cell division septum initiation protein DivIVA